MPHWLAALTMGGEHASLIPLAQDHHDGLCDAARDGELWRLWYTAMPSPEGMQTEITRRLALQAAGSMLPFTVLDAEGVPVGMTTYMNIDAPNRRVEIGSTWYAKQVQRSALNTECKRLLLSHAFEDHGLHRGGVPHPPLQPAEPARHRTPGRASSTASCATHQRMSNGSLRDTCVYSITACEWPAVRTHLDWQLARPR
jgi:N-acetyltransferase